MLRTKMKKSFFLFSMFFLLLLASCNVQERSQTQNATETAIIPTQTKTPLPTNTPTITPTATIPPTPVLDYGFVDEVDEDNEWHGIEFEVDGELVQIVSNLPSDVFQITYINIEQFKDNLDFLGIRLNQGKPTRIEIYRQNWEHTTHCASVALTPGALLCPSRGTDPYRLYLSPVGIINTLEEANSSGEIVRYETATQSRIAQYLLHSMLAAKKPDTKNVFHSIDDVLITALKNEDISFDFIGLDLGDSPFDHDIATSQMIFRDVLENDWNVLADNGEVVTDSGTNTFTGKYAIEVLLSEQSGQDDREWHEANIFLSHKGIDVSQFEWIEFQLYSPEQIGAYMSATAANGEYLTGDPGAITVVPYTREAILINERWQTVRMPLNAIGVDNNELGKIWLRFRSYNKVPVFVDEVRLVSSQ